MPYGIKKSLPVSLRKPEVAFFLAEKAILKPAEVAGGCAWSLQVSESPSEGTGAQLRSPLEGLRGQDHGFDYLLFSVSAEGPRTAPHRYQGPTCIVYLRDRIMPTAILHTLIWEYVLLNSVGLTSE